MKLKAMLTIAAASLAITACGHHSTNNAQPTTLFVGTQNIQANVEYRGQLNLHGKTARGLLREACGDQCQDYSPQALVSFIVMPNSDQATLTIVFPSTSGNQAPATVQRQVRVKQNRSGQSLRFSSPDLSGRLDEDGRLELSSHDGLIGDAHIDNL